MMGTSDSSTGSGVASPRMTLDSTTLKAGSSVLTVCVSEMATAANEMLAATWPTACMAAGPKMFLNSCLVTGCEEGKTGQRGRERRPVGNSVKWAVSNGGGGAQAVSAAVVLAPGPMRNRRRIP